MNFSLELSGALLTGNINPEAMNGMAAVATALLGGMAMIRMAIIIALAIFMIISRWRVFNKASLPGWGILIPCYNRYLMFKLGGRSGRNFLWILIPPVFVVLMIINYFKIAKQFGKHRTYGLGLRFIKIVFIPILAFDNSKYLGKKVTKPVAKMIVTPASKAPVKAVAKKVIKKAPAKKVVKKVKTLIKKK
ncbi:MAG: DUF5684 domain-containing protein [candidate division SR1 bacterium]|nr:DUF5684 domain-containing protein [candidate division SR1 bacterium]